MGQLAPMKFFKFKHDKIIIMHLQGMKNYEIADELGLTPTRVRAEMRKAIHVDIEGRMTELGTAALENIAQTIEVKIEPGHRAKKHQDDVSLKLLDRLGYTPRTDRTIDEGGIRMDRDMQERLVIALEDTEDVHAFDEAEEAEWMDAKEA